MSAKHTHSETAVTEKTGIGIFRSNKKREEQEEEGFTLMKQTIHAEHLT